MPVTETRQAIPPHSTATSDAAFDGPAQVASLSNDAGAATYRRAFAWIDPAADPDTKNAYRFIHHFVGADGRVGAASTRASSAGIAVLNGGRGGTTIPMADHQGVWDHLARHLRDAGQEPPEMMRSAGDDGVETRQARAWGQFRGELRSLEDGDGAPMISGYAAVFNKLSQPLEWGYRERILPGAFEKTIKDGDVRALFNHDPNFVLGRTTAGTLTLREDATGLAFEAHPPDEPWVRSLIASIRRGDIDQASFAFQPVQEDWSKNDKQPVRNIREARLFDVSPVTFPAYVDTIVHARTRSLGEILQGQSEPTTSHSDDQRTAEPTTSHSEEKEPTKIRELGTLVKEWRHAAMRIELDEEEPGKVKP